MIAAEFVGNAKITGGFTKGIFGFSACGDRNTPSPHHRSAMEGRVRRIEAYAKPIVGALPKSEHVNIGHETVRCLWHQFFCEATWLRRAWPGARCPMGRFFLRQVESPQRFNSGKLNLQ